MKMPYARVAARESSVESPVAVFQCENAVPGRRMTKMPRDVRPRPRTSRHFPEDVPRGHAGRYGTVVTERYETFLGHDLGTVVVVPTPHEAGGSG